MRTNNKINPHMTLSPGIEAGPHWWEARALTTVPSLLPKVAKVDQTNQSLQPKITKFSQRELNQRILYRTFVFQFMRN